METRASLLGKDEENKQAEESSDLDSSGGETDAGKRKRLTALRMKKSTTLQVVDLDTGKGKGKSLMDTFKLKINPLSVSKKDDSLAGSSDTPTGVRTVSQQAQCNSKLLAVKGHLNPSKPREQSATSGSFSRKKSDSNHLSPTKVNNHSDRKKKKGSNSSNSKLKEKPPISMTRQKALKYTRRNTFKQKDALTEQSPLPPIQKDNFGKPITKLNQSVVEGLPSEALEPRKS